MTDFPNIITFIQRQRKAATLGNGYPFDRVIPSNVFQTSLCRDVELLVKRAAKLTKDADYWQDEAERLQSELEAKNVDATLTFHKGAE